ncbi:MAG: hypothetical protein LH479_06165 [Polaromonas sp.]|nr:hypothetical protein [Polaromonas sp.]
MNRCLPSPATLPRSLPRRFQRLFAAALLAALGALPTLPAAAQPDPSVLPTVRSFPATALRGRMTVTAPPEIVMDGKPDRLSPGARIRDAQNQLVMSAPAVGQPLLVNYLRDSAGLVHQVWVLNREEAALRRPNSAPTLLDALFGWNANTGPVDDGKTPFDQLPVYGADPRR